VEGHHAIRWDFPTEPVKPTSDVPKVEVEEVETSQPQGDAHAQASKNKSNVARPIHSIQFTAFLDPTSTRPSLFFEQMSRTLPTGSEIIKVGRFSPSRNYVIESAQSAVPVGFQSRVVSRSHCRFWFKDGTCYIRDTKSLSGTFLNDIRLSSAEVESKACKVNDGDIVQLGTNFRGGGKMKNRCVKIRIGLDKDWQQDVDGITE
jgi:pSer/pThr/pTyr-binding forkhead associated (FHA) protein